MPARRKSAGLIGKGEFALALQGIRDDPDREGTYEHATIAAAMKGDTDAAREALWIFITGCDSGTLSYRILDYVKDRLAEIVFDKQAPDVALRIFERRPRGAEYPPTEVVACYFLLLRHGRKPGEAKADLQRIFVRGGKSISDRQIQINANRYAPMREFDDRLLLHLTGSKREQVKKRIEPLMKRKQIAEQISPKR